MTTPLTPRLAGTDLSIGYGGRHTRTVAKGLNCRLYAGQLVCLLGPNGAGKSTLLRTLAGLQPPLAGAVYTNGADLANLGHAERARRFALVFGAQSGHSLLRTHELVALGRQPYTNWQGTLTATDTALITQAMTDCGIAHLADRPLHELSDGERQRAHIARALAQDTPVLLLDEPTAHLDLPGRVSILHLLMRLAHQHHKAILVSTHELDLALQAADSLWLLPPGGPLVAGLPEDLLAQGHLNATFPTEGLHLDPATGRAALLPQGTLPLWLANDSPEACWALRALFRLGFFQASTPEAPWHLDTRTSNGTTHFVLTHHGQPAADAPDMAALLLQTGRHLNQLTEKAPLPEPFETEVTLTRFVN